MKNLFLSFIIFVLPSISFGQTILSDTIGLNNGDKLSYIFKEFPSGKSTEITYVIDEINDTTVIGRFYKGDLTLAFKSPAVGTIGDEVCYGIFEKCSFNPPMKLYDKSMKLGDEWRQNMKVVGETFTSDLAQEIKVIKQEKIRIQIGDFDTFKVVAKGKFRGTNTKGEKFSGTETLELWVGSIGNKLVVLKTNFSNSFYDRWSTELIRGPQ
jgi:hypothetical protein